MARRLDITLSHFHSHSASVSASLSATTAAYQSLDASGMFRGSCVLHCRRETFVPSLRIRRAAVEDHDDLVPIFNAQSEVVTEQYGEFFLAKLIEKQVRAHPRHCHARTHDVPFLLELYLPSSSATMLTPTCGRPCTPICRPLRRCFLTHLLPSSVTHLSPICRPPTMHSH
jgi:hypothetical protein